MTTLVPVLLAGGVGTRLWPTSREAYPKQLLNFTGEESLLQQAARRALTASPADQVVTVTTESHYFAVLDQLGEVSEGLGRHVIAEPAGRNTAAAIALAALYAERHFDDPVLWVAPADHLIRGVEALSSAVESAAAAAADGRLMTFGISPGDADTSLGYIRRGGRLDGHDGIFRVEHFVEKPGREEALRLIAGGDCYWNSGMFVFSAAVLLDEFAALAPDVLEAVRAAVDEAENPHDAAPFRLAAAAYEKVPKIPFDKAVMEKSDRVAVVPLDVGWSDVGSWQRLWEVSDKDANGNVSHGDVLFEDSRNSLARADRRLIACVGVEDIVVVETADAVLVADRFDTAGVKALVARLKAAGRTEATAHLEERRPWGSFSVLLEAEGFKIKELVVKPGAKLSLQKHDHRSEHWVVVQGAALVTRGDEESLLSEDESTYIPIGMVHRLENPGTVELRVIEVQLGDYLGEDDITRLEDSYDRVK